MGNPSRNLPRPSRSPTRRSHFVDATPADALAIAQEAAGGRTMKGYVRVGQAGLVEDAELALWVRLGLSHAQSLPPKKPAKKKAVR